MLILDSKPIFLLLLISQISFSNGNELEVTTSETPNVATLKTTPEPHIKLPAEKGSHGRGNGQRESQSTQSMNSTSKPHEENSSPHLVSSNSPHSTTPHPIKMYTPELASFSIERSSAENSTPTTAKSAAGHSGHPMSLSHHKKKGTIRTHLGYRELNSYEYLSTIYIISTISS
jgi:hypothetical protein